MISVVRKAAACVGLLLILCASACQAGIVIEDAFCRGGQVFLHWSDPDTTYSHYHIYRSAVPIDSSNIQDAELIDSNAPLHTAKDTAATAYAIRTGQPDPNTGAIISDLGTPLDPLDCLEVRTVTTTGIYYYAVMGADESDNESGEPVLRENSLADPIAEAPGSPIPVLIEQGVKQVSGYNYPWKTYTWYRRSDEASRDGEPTRLTITLPTDKDPGTYRFPTMLFLHHYGGTDTKTPWWNTIVIAPFDSTNYLPYSQTTWWYGYANGYPNITAGVVINYTENMLLHMVDWAKRSFPIDANRIVAQGGSMGATGTISFGMRHPELLAGIVAQVPQVNPGLPGIGWSQSELVSIWGSIAANLPTNEGIGVWDRMNMTAYVTNHKEDLPFLRVQNSKNDATLFWFQIPDFYKALNASRHGFISAWGQGGHTSSNYGLPPEYLNFSVFDKIRLNQSYVAVSNSSASKNPGNGDPLDGDSVGQINAGYDWSILSDKADEWKGGITYTPGSEVTADISVRRLQNFNFDAGQGLSYCLIDSATNKVLRWGNVSAERDRFFVIPGLPFNGTRHDLLVQQGSAQTIGNLDEIPEGTSVDLGLMAVTGVFSDMCYAQSQDRTHAVGISGVSGLTEGTLIHVKGTKTSIGGLRVISGSSPTAAAYGQLDIKPFGFPRIYPFLTNQKLSFGKLVKVWGNVKDAGSDWFTIDAGAGPIYIYGSIGTPPVEGALVSVVGIHTVPHDPDTPSCDIRVRHPGDITPP